MARTAVKCALRARQSTLHGPRVTTAIEVRYGETDSQLRWLVLREILLAKERTTIGRKSHNDI